MQEFTERLASLPLTIDRPVVDKTGLTGGYDFSPKFADNAEHLKGALEDVDRGTGQSIFSLVQQQLGLKLEAQKTVKLEAQKTELPVFVVEHAVEDPGAN